MSLTNYLKRLTINTKILLLLFAAILLLGTNLFIPAKHLILYFLCYSSLIIFLGWSCYAVIGKTAFKTMTIFWALGVLIYLCFAIPRIYMHGQLSPYLTLTNISDRWIYSLIMPLIIFGTFSAGLIFTTITSPLEFLKWKKFGLRLTIILRALQHATLIFQETKIALMMQNKWPEETKKYCDLRASWLMLKYSPILLRTAIRNIILFWYPWGWLCFNKLQNNFAKTIKNK